MIEEIDDRLEQPHAYSLVPPQITCASTAPLVCFLPEWSLDEVKVFCRIHNWEAAWSIIRQ